MDIEGRRRSENFEDRGQGAAGASGGGLAVGALVSTLVRRLGLRGTVVLAALAGVAYFVLPSSLRQMLLGAVTGQGAPRSAQSAGGSVCKASASNAKACDFSLAVLGSTEDVWGTQFDQGRLPRYGRPPGPYRQPTLVVFAGGVATGGCGSASSSSGPFYCPADHKLYIDPSFYDLMEQELKAPGDFAQAYVIAHEVGHHVQDLMGATKVRLERESANQTSVRVELQADCLAGVWGHTARADLKITDDDLREAVTAAHAIGDDALGHQDSDDYTHGTSTQRMRWFRKGFDEGDARRCDTFGVEKYSAL